MPWLELHIETHRDAAKTVEYALSKLNALSITLRDNADQPILEPALGEMPLWQDTRVVGLFDASINSDEVLAELKKTLAKGSAFSAEQHQQIARDDSPLVRWHILEDKDWEREWMSHYQPIKCGEGFWICPSWTPPPEPEAINLMLDPGLAFGTGTHPTTYMCLQWLAEQNVEKFSVLDYGCGSGILAIGALLKSANIAYGVDIDPQALQASKTNAERNNIEPDRLKLFFPDAFAEGTKGTEHDLVFANILAAPLVQLADRLVDYTRVGGYLCLSGILADQISAVDSAYQGSCTRIASFEHEEWACLIYKKRHLK